MRRTIFLKTATVILSVFYPFGLYFLHGGARVCLLAAMSALWGARAVFESKDRAIKGASAAFFALCALFSGGALAYLYPLIINFSLAALFALSLRSTPAITRLALLKQPALNERGRIYTRKLTEIWLGFFVLNGLLSAALLLPRDKIYWSVYCGAISYVLIGALIGGEMIFRKFYVKKFD